MNWQAIGAIGENIGAIAVVITLIYLARQVRHARREQQVAAVRTNRDERRSYFEAARDSPYLPPILSKIEAGGALSPEEAQRLLFHNAVTWGLLYSEWIQGQLGLSGEYATSNENNIAIVLRQPWAIEWFREYGHLLYPDSFVSEVERAQEKLDSP